MMKIVMQHSCLMIVGVLAATCCIAQEAAVDSEKPAPVAAPDAGTDAGTEPARASQPPDLFTMILNVESAAEPVPALKYQLRVDDQRLRDGDVMQGVMRAILASKRMIDSDALRQQYADRRDAWFSSPIDDEAQKEIRDYLTKHDKVLVELHRAALYRNVSQDSRFLELSGAEVYGIVLDEIQELRDLGRLVELESTLAIAEGRFDDALKSIQTGIRIAEAASLRTPTLIGKLVGVAIAGMMLEQVRMLSTMPGAPNLYWAIATFPTESFDMQPAYEAEMDAMRRFLGPIGSLEAPLDDEAWRQKLITVVKDFGVASNYSADDGFGPFSDPAFASGLFIIATDGPARAYLSAHGVDPVEMSPCESILRAVDLELRIVRDQNYKWTLLPRSMHGDRLQSELVEHPIGFTSSKDFPPAQILANLLLPAIKQVENASLRLQRQIAFLATSEAIRMHAAKDGEFPDSIEDLQPVPAWLEPTTLEPFPYKRLSPNTAVLMRTNLPASPKLEWQLRLSNPK